MSEAKKNASAKGEKAMDKDKEEVLENIMEELEQEAKDKEKEESADTSKEDSEQEAADKDREIHNKINRGVAGDIVVDRLSVHLDRPDVARMDEH